MLICRGCWGKCHGSQFKIPMISVKIIARSGQGKLWNFEVTLLFAKVNKLEISQVEILREFEKDVIDQPPNKRAIDWRRLKSIRKKIDRFLQYVIFNTETLEQANVLKVEGNVVVGLVWAKGKTGD